jgi:signal transduction histidine kinase
VGLLGSNLQTLQIGPAAAPGEVLASLYFIPIVIAAVCIGSRAAVVVSMAAGGSHCLMIWLAHGDHLIEPVAETVLFLCVGLTTAKLAEWLRSQPASLPTAGGPPAALGQTLHQTQAPTDLPALGQVVAALAKQFRNPVASIEGAGWVLEDSALADEKRREFVAIIRKESHRLNRVLSDVLDFTRPRSPQFETVAAAKLIHEVVQLARPKDHGPFLLFKTDIAAGFPPLRCDPEQIRQVLLHLTMNAIQASPGGGQIAISAQVEGSYAVIRVTDHGRGISPAILGRIFDPFFTTNENCIGLGLSVAAHIVHEHGGKIAVDSTSAQGTCFSVALPV